MANAYKHKRYFQIQEVQADSSLAAKTFTGTTAEAYAEFGFSSAWDTSSPTKTMSFEDSNATLVVTYEFNNESDQSAFKTAVDAAYADGSAWGSDLFFKHTKTEWLAQDGTTVSATSTDIV